MTSILALLRSNDLKLNFVLEFFRLYKYFSNL